MAAERYFTPDSYVRVVLFSVEEEASNNLSSCLTDVIAVDAQPSCPTQMFKTASMTQHHTVMVKREVCYAPLSRC